MMQIYGIEYRGADGAVVVLGTMYSTVEAAQVAARQGAEQSAADMNEYNGEGDIDAVAVRRPNGFQWTVVNTLGNAEETFTVVTYNLQ